jgi:hypothetical protein
MYPINALVVERLVSLREHVEAKMEAAWGPEAIAPSVAATKAMPGTLGATNPSDTDDALNSYLNNLIDQVLGSFDMSEDQAVDFVFSSASSHPRLGAVPEDGASPTEIAVWLATAATVQFGGYVLGQAQAAM